MSLWGTDRIRLTVIRELPDSAANDMLQMLGPDPVRAVDALKRYNNSNAEMSTLIYRIYEHHQAEGLTMPVSLEKFIADTEQYILAKLPYEERLRGVPTEERLRGLSLEEQLRNISVEDLKKYLETIDLKSGKSVGH